MYEGNPGKIDFGSSKKESTVIPREVPSEVSYLYNLIARAVRGLRVFTSDEHEEKIRTAQ